LNVPVWLFFDGREEKRTTLRVDTVLIEADEKTVRMTSRIKFPFERGPNRLVEVLLGHVTQGYMRSKIGRKDYMGSQGTNTQIPVVTL
jgi:hypothetical protein